MPWNHFSVIAVIWLLLRYLQHATQSTHFISTPHTSIHPVRPPPASTPTLQAPRLRTLAAASSVGRPAAVAITSCSPAQHVGASRVPDLGHLVHISSSGSPCPPGAPNTQQARCLLMVCPASLSRRCAKSSASHELAHPCTMPARPRPQLPRKCMSMRIMATTAPGSNTTPTLLCCPTLGVSLSPEICIQTHSC